MSNPSRSTGPAAWTAQNVTRSRQVTGPVTPGQPLRLLTLPWRSAIDVYIQDRDGVWAGSLVQLYVESGGTRTLLQTVPIPAVGGGARVITERTTGGESYTVEILPFLPLAGAVLLVSATAYGREPAAVVQFPDELPVKLSENETFDEIGQDVWEETSFDLGRPRLIATLGADGFAGITVCASSEYLGGPGFVTNPFEDSFEIYAVPGPILLGPFPDPDDYVPAIVGWLWGRAGSETEDGPDLWRFSEGNYPSGTRQWVFSYGGLLTARWYVFARPGLTTATRPGTRVTLNWGVRGERHPVVSGSAPAGAWNPRCTVPPFTKNVVPNNPAGTWIPSPVPETAVFPNPRRQTCPSPAVFRSGNARIENPLSSDLHWCACLGGPWFLTDHFHGRSEQPLGGTLEVHTSLLGSARYLIAPYSGIQRSLTSVFLGPPSGASTDPALQHIVSAYPTGFPASPGSFPQLWQTMGSDWCHGVRWSENEEAIFPQEGLWYFTLQRGFIG